MYAATHADYPPVATSLPRKPNPIVAVVRDEPDGGNRFELVRDDGGRVGWIRVVARVAVRVP